MAEALLWAPRAWLPGGWADAVALRIGTDGRWAEITPGIVAPPRDAQRLAGPLFPGLVDAHSHAFQRAFAGLAERREAASDDFWSWRDRMYAVALRIGPEALRAVAAQLQVELLRGGFTHVCEFHYLQHDRDGRPYADPLALAWSIVDAAGDSGIGLTMLPVLYERAGFAQSALRDDQRRFRTDAAWVWDAAQRIAAAGRRHVGAGVAVHSLRAATPGSIHALRQRASDWSGPIHVHVAEQTAEVDDCLAATGRRPIEWLAAEGLVDPRWQLVHATHATPEEIDAIAASGAGVIVCPSTEANLGDGLFDLRGWLGAGVPVSIGTDSHVGRDALEELRWLEYGQRLALRRRNVAADPGAGRAATAARLFDEAVHAGGRAAGESSWGLVVGARADALVADLRTDALRGVPPDRLLDALVFATPVRPWRDVMVAGRWLLQDHRHAQADAIGHAFEAAMTELWRDDGAPAA